METKDNGTREFVLGTRIFCVSKPREKDKQVINFLAIYYEEDTNVQSSIAMTYVWYTVRLNQNNEHISFSDFMRLPFKDKQLDDIVNYLLGMDFLERKNE